MQIINAFRQAQLPMTKGTLTGPTITSAFNMLLRHLAAEGRRNPIDVQNKLNIGIYAHGEDGHNYATLLYLLNEYGFDHVLQLITRIRMPAVRIKLIQWAEDLLDLAPGMAHQIAHWRGGNDSPLIVSFRPTPPGTGLRIFAKRYRIMQYLYHSLIIDHIGLAYV